MKRSIMDDLIKWKDQSDRKPLILKGVRQCGKTYVIREFGMTRYEDISYFNFEGNPALSERFQQDLDPHRIIMELSVLQGKKIKPGSTLIILDEIQFCDKALTALKYFQEQAPEYHIVCAGSLLGIRFSQPSSFPVGKVDMITMRPMSFVEFLWACGEMMLVDYIGDIKENDSVPQMFAEKLASLLKIYYIVGGMPAAVVKWIETRDVEEVERVQDLILNSYEIDFAKYLPAMEHPKLSMIWLSIPGQLAKENGKFFYGHAKPGARAKDLEDSVQWLIDAGLVYKVSKVEKPFMPLSAYADRGHFKLYLADVGLLRRKAHLPASAILEDNTVYSEFKGALAENYVLTEFISMTGEVPYFWKSGNTAEVDFVLQLGSKIVPVEVKSSSNIKSRSLSVYREKYVPELSVRASMRDMKKDDGLLNIPLFMIWMAESLAGRS